MINSTNKISTSSRPTKSATSNPSTAKNTVENISIQSPSSRASGGIDSVMADSAEQHEIRQVATSTCGEGADVMDAAASDVPCPATKLGALATARATPSQRALYGRLTGVAIVRARVLGAPRVGGFTGFLLSLGAGSVLCCRALAAAWARGTGVRFAASWTHAARHGAPSQSSALCKLVSWREVRRDARHSACAASREFP